MKYTLNQCKYIARRRIGVCDSHPVLISAVYFLIQIPLLILFLLLTGYLQYLVNVLTEYQALMATKYAWAASARSGVSYGILKSAFEEAITTVEPRTPGVLGLVLAAAVALMGLVLRTGQSWGFLAISREKNVRIRNYFDGFDSIFRVGTLVALRAVLVMLGFGLFFLPGIYLHLRYRMAAFVMADYPELNPLQCLRKSAKLIRGNELRLLVMDLSFFGWHIINYLLIAFALVPMASIWLRPYTQVSRCMFYNDLVKWYPEDHLSEKEPAAE